MCRNRNLIASGKLPLLLVFFVIATTEHGLSAESPGVTVGLEKYEGPATVRVESVGRYNVKIDVDRKTERNPLTLAVELPETGSDAWRFIDVEVLDSNGRPVSVRRGGIEWHKLWITVPAAQSRFLVHAVDPPGERPQMHPEKDRHVSESTTGFSATIGKWPDGRRAALSLRFDDSHPTHLSKAIPILREYGFRGTFMINPGGRDGRSPNPRWRSAFQTHRAEWESVARRGDQEFANPTMRHRGAENDADMEREVGDAAKAIWELFPGKSKLVALNLGGGTQWQTTRTLRYYLDKYHLFATSGSLGMDDVYGNRLDAFRQHLIRHIEREGWCRVHFHYIGDNLSTSEAHFRAALDVAKEHEAELWIAGMADIYKYQTERRGATLALEKSRPNGASLRLSCSTKPELYDQPLTIEVTLPKSWLPNHMTVTNAQDKAIATRSTQTKDRTLLRFEVAPRNALYSMEMIP